MVAQALDIQVPEMRGFDKKCLENSCEPLVHLIDHVHELTVATRKMADNHAELTGLVIGMKGELKGVSTAVAAVSTALNLTGQIAQAEGRRAAQESVPNLVEEAELSRRMVSQRVRAEKREKALNWWRGYFRRTAVDWVFKTAIGAASFEGLREVARLFHLWH